MVKFIPFSVISRVTETWEMARQKPCFEEKVGTLALERLFDMEPRVKKVFGLDGEKAGLQKMGILIHAIRMIQALDAALCMLGPDTETLTLILQDLGKRHVRYGVSPHFFPFLGHALILALSEILEDEWMPDMREAWQEVYDELSGEMMKAMLNHPPSQSQDQPST